MNQVDGVGTCLATMPLRLVCSSLVLAGLPLLGCSVGGEPDHGGLPGPGLAPSGGDDDLGTDSDAEDFTDTGDEPRDTDEPDTTTTTTTTSGEPEGDSSTTDPGCVGDCIEHCLDGQDDDGDGDIDCHDSDCSAHLACTCTLTPDEGFGPHVLCDDPMTWAAARDACEASDMHLVSIDSGAHNAWLTERSQGIDPTSWWMGLSDLQIEGSWSWVDGSPLGYQHWFPGEPNNGIDAPEHCVAFPEHDAYSWNDLECSMVRPFICEP